MTAILIDGKKVAERVRQDVAGRVAAFVDEHGRSPGLATILLGDDPASKVYVGGKEKACKEVGIHSVHHYLPESTSEPELLDLVADLGDDDTIDGILVQLPLPGHINEKKIIEAIPTDKDVDGFHPYNVGLLAAGKIALPQCTPFGIVKLLDEYNVPIEGANVTIVGRSAIVGRPLALMLLARHATVTIAHSRTKDLAAHTSRADILIAAVGKPGLITADMVKPGAAVIDVGVNRTDTGLKGDVDYDAVSAVAGWISPVPGGVGPMTICMLVENTLQAAIARLVAQHESV